MCLRAWQRPACAALHTLLILHKLVWKLQSMLCRGCCLQMLLVCLCLVDFPYNYVGCQCQVLLCGIKSCASYCCHDHARQQHKVSCHSGQRRLGDFVRCHRHQRLAVPAAILADFCCSRCCCCCCCVYLAAFDVAFHRLCCCKAVGKCVTWVWRDRGVMQQGVASACDHPFQA